jgi:hypothetical protein
VCAEQVLILSSGDSSLDALTAATLARHGYSAEIGPQYFQFDGSLNLSGYGAVLLLASQNWYVGDMPNRGQNALTDFVHRGGGLVTVEWVT